MVIWFFVGFWIKFGSRKLLFGLTLNKMFFLIQSFNILQFTKTFNHNMCVLSFKKINKWFEKQFSWMWHKNKNKIKTFCQKKVLVCSKMLFLVFLNPLKLLSAKCYIIFISHSWKMLFQPFIIFYKTKRTCCQQKFL